LYSIDNLIYYLQLPVKVQDLPVMKLALGAWRAKTGLKTLLKHIARPMENLIKFGLADLL